MRAFTDCRVPQLGDAEGRVAPMRGCEVVAWDGDRRVTVRFVDAVAGTVELEVSRFSVYWRVSKRRMGHCVTTAQLEESARERRAVESDLNRGAGR